MQIKQEIYKNIDKGQKIIAALYLVTAHVSDSDPIKQTLRTLAIDLLSPQKEVQKATVAAIETLLGAAVLAHIISDKNASIINLEIRHFIATNNMQEDDAISDFFVTESLTTGHVLDTKRTFSSVKKKDINIGHQLQGTGSDKIYKVKGDRQQTIMTFIDDRKAASIKDISALFTDVSEKTIQRELSSLVASGKISKRGSKRWSVYMAAGTPV